MKIFLILLLLQSAYAADLDYVLRSEKALYGPFDSDDRVAIQIDDARLNIVAMGKSIMVPEEILRGYQVRLAALSPSVRLHKGNNNRYEIDFRLNGFLIGKTKPGGWLSIYIEKDNSCAVIQEEGNDHETKIRWFSLPGWKLLADPPDFSNKRTQERGNQ
ncbi:MAG: hypothetical protein WC661_19920 [Opitutaceae bacterium]|jgi:hypothetical protein